MTLMKVKQKKMNKLDRIIKESIDRVISENNFRSKRAQMMAAAHAAEKDGDKDAVERTKNMLAKRAAVQDINKDRAEKRSKHIFDPSDMWCLDKEHRNGEKEFFKGEDEFYRPIKPEDLDF